MTFQGKDIHPPQVSHQIRYACRGSWKLGKRVKPSCILKEPKHDKSKAFFFFYSVFQGTLGICGASGILFINKNHHVSFKDAIDQGTNNRAKLFALVAS
jgi:hypothetical protein